MTPFYEERGAAVWRLPNEQHEFPAGSEEGPRLVVEACGRATASGPEEQEPSLRFAPLLASIRAAEKAQKLVPVVRTRLARREGDPRPNETLCGSKYRSQQVPAWPSDHRSAKSQAAGEARPSPEPGPVFCAEPGWTHCSGTRTRPVPGSKEPKRY